MWVDSSQSAGFAALPGALWIGMFFLCAVSRFVLRFSWFYFAFQLVSVGFILRFIFVLVGRQVGPAGSSTAAGATPPGKVPPVPGSPSFHIARGGSGAGKGVLAALRRRRKIFNRFYMQHGI